jgi:hypothetical protein
VGATGTNEGTVVLTVLNWLAVALLLAALVPAALAWAGRVRFDRWLPPESSRPAGRAFTILDIGALLQAVAQLVGGNARWYVSTPGLVLVLLGALLTLRLRQRTVTSR